MNDPLKRRMFAQQVMNMYNSRQPMGILASSPELMGAVQNYAGGGAVKGYRFGGIGGTQKINITASELEQLNKGAVTATPSFIENKYANVFFDRNTQTYKMKPEVVETGTTGNPLIGSDVFKKQEKEKIEGKDLATVEKEIKDELKIQKDKAKKDKANIP